MLSRNREALSQAGYTDSDHVNEYPEEGKIAIRGFHNFSSIIHLSIMEEKMKKTLSLLAVILVLVFAVSCGGGKKDDKETIDPDEDTTDDTDVADSDTGNETDTDSDTTPDNPDDSDTTPDNGDTTPDDDGDTTPAEEPVKTHGLIGRYADSWGGSHIISNTAWFEPSSYGDSLFHITQFDNEKGFMIAQNDKVKSWNPEKWSRFDYIKQDGKIYYCQIVYDKDTEAEALAATDADRADTATGCNGNSWTELVEVEETSLSKDDTKIAAWATGYENYEVGENVDEKWQTPEKALGKAEGTSEDVVVLGEGGSIVLTFAKPVTDGEGADFAVFENSFDDGFLELATVEVSSDGENFVAFDNYYLGVEKIGSYENTQQTRLIWGFAGKFKQGEGTMFDLAELAGKPEVVSGKVDLKAITHIKIIDIIGDGSKKDSIGNPVYDPYPNTGSAGFDLDAVAVINEFDPLEITGKWYAYQFGQYDTISEKGWSQFNVMYGGSSNYAVHYNIVEYNNGADTFIAYKEDSKYSKVNWILKNENAKEFLYICEQSFGNETIEAAKAAADANKEDLEHGCGSNFSWNMYVRAGTTSTDAKEDMYAEREAPANANDDYIDVWASGYDAFNPGYGADLDQNNPENVKGTADGKFLSLGKGGSVIVTFTDPLLLDGGEMGEIGSDFIIFANSANNHALAKVEVSSDGETFVAFDTYFTGNGLGESEIFGFAGKFANGKGTKFDLSDLLLKPEVKEGKVDLEAITIIRITDIPGDGSVTDSHGNPIFYPYPAGGFELDAVAAVNEKE